MMHTPPNTRQMTTPHCESCGQPNPPVHDGYTVCCNELVCYGDPVTWVAEDGRTVEACCGARALPAFEAMGSRPRSFHRA